MAGFTHIDEKGSVSMVDVSPKAETARTAVAMGRISMTRDTFEAVMSSRISKGNVLETARIAAIMAAKNTASLIPLCHPLMISHAQVDFIADDKASSIEISASVKCSGQTGVEMEALTAVSVAALTIYDMCKAMDKKMIISDIRLVEKTGGKSDSFSNR